MTTLRLKVRVHISCFQDNTAMANQLLAAENGSEHLFFFRTHLDFTVHGKAILKPAVLPEYMTTSSERTEILLIIF
jgi:hypothetical protein